MTSIGTPSGVERQQFFDGQRLFADDLQQIERFHREMRELHNRSLHQPGVGSGFAVSGNVGDREVRIGPGYAIDDEGHEIILTSEHVEPIPPVAGASSDVPAYFDLTVAYPSAEELEAVETRRGICRPPGVVRLREEPVFCWIKLQRDESDELVIVNKTLSDELERGARIRIARIGVLDCQLKKLSIAERRDARPKIQPYVFGGRERAIFCEREKRYVCTIDTSNARFATTPSYLVSWEIDVEPVTAGVGAAMANDAVHSLIRALPPFLVEKPNPTSFELVLNIDASTLRKVGVETQVNAQRQECFTLRLVNFVWIGVE